MFFSLTIIRSRIFGPVTSAYRREHEVCNELLATERWKTCYQTTSPWVFSVVDTRFKELGELYKVSNNLLENKMFWVVAEKHRRFKFCSSCENRELSRKSIHLNKKLMYVCMYVCVFVSLFVCSFITWKIVGRFWSVFFIELLKAAKVARAFFPQSK